MSEPRAHRSAGGTLAELVRHQIRSTPDAPAVVAGDVELTYAELGRRVAVLSARLRALGAGRGRTVAVALPHGAAQVTVLLALVETGATYLPLDVTHPAERIRHMLDDAAPHCVVAGDDVAPVLDAARLDPSVRRVRLEDLTAENETRAEDGAPAEHETPAEEGAPTREGTPAEGRTPTVAVTPGAGAAVPSDIAYLIYTSGSTGRPKGVAVSHASLVSNLRWVQRRYDLRPGDRMLQKTPLGFDVSVWELCWPLVTGATLVVAEPAIHQDPVALAELMTRQRVTVAHFVPSMLAVFLDSASLSGCATLRMVVLSGEAVPARLCRSFFDACDATLHNLYGPTEGTIHVTSWDIPRPLPTDTVPIGRPVDHTRLYVLDDLLRPVPTGESGDLYLGGAQVALGYLNNLTLTAERFVACPFGPPGERMYRTGDLARWNPDGDLEYLGRSDSQVKVNGVRIEIAEVETALERHPAVRQAAVVPTRADNGDQRLSALVTLDTAGAPGADRLLRLTELPEASRPTIVEVAAGLPVCVPDGTDPHASFREVFDDEVYTRGVVLPENAWVLDVGANVGLFTLLVGTRTPGARIVAAEPVPERFDALRRNVNLYGLDAVLLPYRLGASPGELAEPFPVSVRTISQVLDEEGVDRLALLRIGVEAGEDVLAGIEDRHWPEIDRISLRAPGTGRRRVEALLAERGFTVRSWRSPEGGPTYLHATRGEGLPPAGDRDVDVASRPTLVSLPSLLEEIRAEAATVLPSAMLPATITAVSRLPLTANGKLDRARIRSLDPVAVPGSGRRATTELERTLCDLIGQAVGVPTVGADDNLFRLGATSLSAVRLTGAISKRFGVPFRLRMVVASPTAAGLARQVTELLDTEGTELPGTEGADAPAANPSGTDRGSGNSWRSGSRSAPASR
ncbi:methyltransferase, FkbM family/amino acid adenylation domain-containing protein [Micromonospora pallida]|uniref:Methyltransferase, FkbM family/amino acid adenylation domain-containing protein n=1 Tax=Micromonospora pallida TaxID=145854 RepID=A0A1C6SCY6_9ACTN|nr:amino acid adenylation domain-containing protein [Micromonospora pallida]SCL27341.1 methyltransferase, FkbM family/amino acid adenylation domain-containing protein [Micromonospora pallida]